MYEEDLALSNLQWLIWHKTEPKPNKIFLQDNERGKGSYKWRLCLIYGQVTLKTAVPDTQLKLSYEDPIEQVFLSNTNRSICTQMAASISI